MTELSNLKKVKSFDIEQFDGLKSTIGSVELMDVETKDFGDGAKEVRQVLVKSTNLGDNVDKPICASEYIGLKKDEDGNWGMADAKNSKAMRFLSYFKVENLEDLNGKECLIVKRDKGNKDILGIHFG